MLKSGGTPINGPPRWDLYRALFAKVGSESGITFNRYDFEIIEATRGIYSDAGALKGYWYTTTKPRRLMRSLDECPTTDIADNDLPAKHIIGHWYIFLDCS